MRATSILICEARLPAAGYKHYLRLITVGVACTILVACPTRPLEKPLIKNSTEITDYHPQTLEKDIDLLFVIDNSKSMAQEQENLANQFPALIEALRTPKLENAIPNVHIGVVSSDLGAGNFTSISSCGVVKGDSGLLQTSARISGCSSPAPEKWIKYIEGQTNLGSSSGDPVNDVKEAFKCIATLGTNGCAFEQPLEAARLALDSNLNPGFLRPDAFLAIIFITDEDDCSARNPGLFDPSRQALGDPLGPLNSFRCAEFGLECDGKNIGRQPNKLKSCRPSQDYLHSVDDYAEFFSTIKPDGRFIMFAIAGPTNALKDLPLQQQPSIEIGLKDNNPDLKPSCASKMGTAVPAIRIQSVIDHEKMKEHSQKGYFNGITQSERNDGKQETVNICSADFTAAMKQLGEVIIVSLGGQCLGAWPLSANEQLLCSAGDDLGGGRICSSSCLDQADCNVEQISQPTTANEVRKTIDKCPAELFDPAIIDCGAHCPCWRIIPNKKDCTVERNGSPYGLNIMRELGSDSKPTEPPRGTMARVSCNMSSFTWGSPTFEQLPYCQ